jgi:predicted transcriptional regulator
MGKGLGKVQTKILDRVASWQLIGYRSDHLGWALPEGDKSVYRAIKSLQERGLVYRVCGDGTQPRKQRIKRGKGYYTKYICDCGETRVMATPSGLTYWAEHIADTEII